MAILFSIGAWGQVQAGEPSTPESAETPIALDPFVVVAERAFAADGGSVVRPVWTRREIDREDPGTLDGLLRKNPLLSTYRRTTGLTAHPTTQGVRLRDAATNATSRALVLFEGVPQNDPFGGWVEWNRLPLEGIESIRLYPNGRQGAWGNLSSGGVVSLTPRPVIERQGRISLMVGSLNTYRLSGSESFPVGAATAMALEGTAFSTDGYNPVDPGQRGAIDEEAWSRFATLTSRIEHRLSKSVTITGSISVFEEERGNGTPLSGNESSGVDFSVRLRGETTPESGWQTTLFHQRREFSNVFTSVNQDRTTELPALDQYDVPSTASGISLSWNGQPAVGWEYLTGVDVRTVDGEVNERYRNLGQGFTRDRSAGGKQFFAGGFASLRTTPFEDLTLEGTVRLDKWRSSGGFRRETDIGSGQVLSDLNYDDSSGWEPTLGLSATFDFYPGWQTRLQLSSGFRSPTLNELARPFRVGNDITEANADLQPETTEGWEWSVSQTGDSPVRVELILFGYRLEDMIANVFRASGPGFDPFCGFIPDGGTCSRRENIQRSRAIGGELRLEAGLSRSLTAALHLVHTETCFERSPTQTALEGRSFPQAPVDRLTVSADWWPADWINGSVRLNHTSGQYEDPLNTRELDAATTIDLGVNARWPGTRWSLVLAIRNLLDAEIQAGIAGNGLVTLAEPRMINLSVRYGL